MSTDAPKAKAPQRARGVQRVSTLLDAGAALFAAKGYGGTTMTEIAQHAGASIGSLYQFFPSKEALAEALFDRYAQRLADRLEELIAGAPGLAPQRLADRLIDLMLEIRSDRDASAALSGAIAGIVERRKPLRDATRRQLAAILQAANPTLSEPAAAAAATLAAHFLKLIPTLAAEEDGRGTLVGQARQMLTAYLECLIPR